jgi:hypothetical protein
MTTRTRFVGLVTMALVFTWFSFASAGGIVTLDFPADLVDTCVPICSRNATADGFRISAETHYDRVVTFGCTVDGCPPGIGWDRDGDRNSEYLGSSVPLPPPGSFPFPPFFPPIALYVDHDGRPFGLLSLDSLGGTIVAESSRGGLATIPRLQPPFTPLHFDFVGPEWRDLQWVAFFSDPPGAPTSGFSQLVTLVPGPPTLGLLGLGVLILGWRLRSSARHPKR